MPPKYERPELPGFDEWLAGVRERLKAARVGAGLSVRGAGARCGVSFSAVSRVESGDVPPTLDLLVRLSDGYGVKLSEILTGWPPKKGKR